MLLNAMKAKVELLRSKLKANLPFQPFKGKYIDLLCDTLQTEIEHIRDIWQQHAAADLPGVLNWVLLTGYHLSRAKTPLLVRPFVSKIVRDAQKWLRDNPDVFKDTVGVLSK